MVFVVMVYVMVGKGPSSWREGGEGEVSRVGQWLEGKDAATIHHGKFTSTTSATFDIQSVQQGMDVLGACQPPSEDGGKFRPHHPPPLRHH